MDTAMVKISTEETCCLRGADPQHLITSLGGDTDSVSTRCQSLILTPSDSIGSSQAGFGLCKGDVHEW